MMTYPPVSVCTEGTESIQRFLCSGEVYSIIKLAFGLLQKKISLSNTSFRVSVFAVMTFNVPDSLCILI